MIERPNLLFVMADQLRYQSVGYAGDPLAKTPVIDDLAAQSTSFENAVATGPVCAAMRASLMTGTHPSTNGMAINELRLNPAQRCFGHRLTDAGYDTAYLGKWHLYANELGNHADPKNAFVPRGPHRLGFDGYWASVNFHHGYFGSYYHTESADPLSYGDGVYEPDGQTSLTIEWLTEHANRERPFALFLSWGPPHDPWDDDNVPDRFRAMHDVNDFAHPPNYVEENDPYGDFWSQLSERDREALPLWRRNYYAMTTSLDWNVGRLLDALDRLDIADDTVLVFTSDHGELLGAHGRRAKNVFYEEAVRVPFLIRWPGAVPAGRTSDVCLSTVDVMPTLLGLAGIEVDCEEGMDLSPHARGSEGPEPDLALLQGMGPVALFLDGFEWRAVRDKRNTYARWRRDGSEHLYDNLADPYQLHNLAGDPAARDTLTRLRDAMAAKMDELGDTFEASSWYEANFTDGNRNIVRGARGEFGYARNDS